MPGKPLDLADRLADAALVVEAAAGLTGEQAHLAEIRQVRLELRVDDRALPRWVKPDVVARRAEANEDEANVCVLEGRDGRGRVERRPLGVGEDDHDPSLGLGQEEMRRGQGGQVGEVGSGPTAVEVLRQRAGGGQVVDRGEEQLTISVRRGQRQRRLRQRPGSEWQIGGQSLREGSARRSRLLKPRRGVG